METKTATPITKVITPTMVKPSSLKYDASIVEARKRFAEKETRRQMVESRFKEGMAVAAYLQKKTGQADFAKTIRVEAHAEVVAAGFYVKSVNGALEVR